MTMSRSPECAAAIVSIATAAPEAFLVALEIPLDEKQRVLTALGERGAGASTPLAAAYLFACERAATVTDAASVNHLEQTADAALAALAGFPDAARSTLSESASACASTGAERVSALALNR